MDCTIEDLYNSFRGKLKAFIASRTRDDALAEDLVQDTFVKLAGFQDVRITIKATSGCITVDDQKSQQILLEEVNPCLRNLSSVSYSSPLSPVPWLPRRSSGCLQTCLPRLRLGRPCALARI
jgi:hypothetical protein